jgi:ribosomal protein L32
MAKTTGAAKAVQDGCPNDGTPKANFVEVPRRRNTDSDDRQRDTINEQRDALDAERGALLKCPTCGYQTRAHDELTPAKA